MGLDVFSFFNFFFLGGIRSDLGVLRGGRCRDGE